MYNYYKYLICHNNIVYGVFFTNRAFMNMVSEAQYKQYIYRLLQDKVRWRIGKLFRNY